MYEPKNITIRDILPLVKWEDVKRAIKYFYPEDKNDYSELFEDLKTLKKRKHKDPKEFLEIFCAGGLGDTLKEWAEDKFYSIHTNLYGLSFRKYSELVNIPIEEETLRRFKLEDIVAHFIWEITFYGSPKQAEEIVKTLKKRIKQVKKDIHG